MLDDIKIILETEYTKDPPAIEVKVNDEIIFSGEITKNETLTCEQPLEDRLLVSIKKTGKTESLAKNGEIQDVRVGKMLLNGLDQHPDKFGSFTTSNNFYVEEKTYQGDKMSFNGVWSLDVPVFRQSFNSTLDKKSYRDEFCDCRTACFGDSFTWGQGVDADQTWPHYLSMDEVKNYGAGGNSISSILGTAEWYSTNFKCENLILLLPHPCRLQLNDGNEWVTLMPGRTPDVEKKFKKLARDIVLFGEPSLIMSGYANELRWILKQINRNVNRLFISSYQEDVYECLQEVSRGLADILPRYELSEEHELAMDGEHPGPDHHKQFATQIRTILGG